MLAAVVVGGDRVNGRRNKQRLQTTPSSDPVLIFLSTKHTMGRSAKLMKRQVRPSAALSCPCVLVLPE